MLTWLKRVLRIAPRNDLSLVLEDNPSVDEDRWDDYHNSNQWGR